MSPGLADAELIDLAGRIMWTHAINPQRAVRVLGITTPEAEKMVRAGRLAEPLAAARRERLLLFVNILARLEHRLRHDSRAIRDALKTPLNILNGGAIADRLGGSFDDLRALRHAIEALQVVKEKWWRVGY